MSEKVGFQEWFNSKGMSVRGFYHHSHKHYIVYIRGTVFKKDARIYEE